MLDLLKSLDEAAFYAINGAAGSPALDTLMLVLSARATWAVIGVALVGAALWRRRGDLLRLVLAIGLAIALADLVTYQVLKPTFARERPCHQLVGQIRLLQPSCGSDYGFPSNHAANGMAIATAVAVVTRHRSALVVALIAALVGLSRIYLGAHFPGDVLAGFVVGALIGVAAAWLVRRIPPSRWLPARG
jgi:undecaprenyl-diphosphatase